MGSCVKWTPEEDAVLRRLHAAGLDWATCSTALGRTEKACESRWRNLNAPRVSKGRPWTEEEDETLRSVLAKGLSWSDAAVKLPGRSSRACMARGKVLGVAMLKPILKRPDALSLRRCHDCGKATVDYRCPKCLAKWRRRNGVAAAGGEEEDSYASFGGAGNFDC